MKKTCKKISFLSFLLSLGTLMAVSCQHKDASSGSSALSAADFQQIDSCRQRLFEGPQRFWLPQDDTAYFDTFFVRASQAQAQGHTVRILHYGDSQIEADRISAQLRERMQQLFGGGGPGLVPFKQTVPALTVRQRTEGPLVGQSTYGNKPFVRCDGHYGPMLRSWKLDGSASLTLSTEHGRYAPEHGRRFSRVRILLRNNASPVTVHNQSLPDHSLTSSRQGVQMIELGSCDTVERAKLSIRGAADIFGLLLDNGYGVAVDNIAMRGSAGTQFTMVDSLQLLQSYSLMDVGMIILQFGGNAMPGLQSEKQVAYYTRKIGSQIDYLHSVCPETPILFVGPADMGVKRGGKLASHPMVATLDRQLRETALAHGAAYWSVYQTMGGEDSMAQWVEQGLANKDYIHFSHQGAARMGNLMADALECLYRFYHLRTAQNS